jgi:hypothetical protein
VIGSPIMKMAEYKTPRASVRGVFLCENVADTVFSPVRRADVEPWVDGGDVGGSDGTGEDVFLTL